MTHPTTENLQAIANLLTNALFELTEGDMGDAIPDVKECIERLEAMGIYGESK